MHLLIAFAATADPFALPVLRTLQLPHLQSLLRGYTPGALDTGTAQDFCMPHERFMLKTLGSAAAEPPQALISPCHWQVGQGQVIMGHPEDLALNEDESQTLLAAMQPYFYEDGISLAYESPLRWQARGEVFRNLPSASLERVIGQNIDDWLTHSAQARPLHRLQNEMQMLLYTHPCNDARNERGLKSVNSFWVSETAPYPVNTDRMETNNLHVVQELARPALAQDWAAWAQAWQALDASLFSPLSVPAEAITLCGTRHTQTWHRQPLGLWQKIKRNFSQKPLSVLFSSL